MKQSVWMKLLAWVVSGVMMLSAAVPALAWSATNENALFGMADYQAQQVTEPMVSQSGGEWLIIALARSGVPVPDGYYLLRILNWLNIKNVNDVIIYDGEAGIREISW